MSEDFDTNLLRITAATVGSLLSLAVAREMFGKGYFELGTQERIIVDQNTAGMLWAHYNDLAPGAFAGPAPASTMGFQPNRTGTD